MRIAVFHNLQSSGGAKRALVEMSRQLRERGHTLDAHLPTTAEERFLPVRDVVDAVYTYRVAAWDRSRDRRLTTTIRRLPAYIQTIRAARNVERAIAASIDARGYDVVFVHHGRYTQAPWLLRYVTTPSVYYCQEPPRDAYEAEHQPSRRRLLRLWMPVIGWARIDRVNAGGADMILSNSFYSREVILRTYGREPSVVYLGVDDQKFTPGSAARNPIVLSVGALHPRKGHELAVEAVAKISPDRRPCLRIIGDRGVEGYAEHLRNVAAIAGVQLRLDIGLSEHELVRAYQTASVVACGAQLEPFGLVPLEAAACGTPVVAVREGGLRETVLDGVTGVLVNTRDAGEFGAALQELLWNRARWLALSNASVDWARTEWSWERTGDRLVEELATARSRTSLAHA